MRDVLRQIEAWRAEGRPIALATVVETWGSAPRRSGAKMAMTPAGGIAGSVSGGCVESAVFEAGLETIRSGRPRLIDFGVTDEKAWEVGLACGGRISVFVEPLDETLFDSLRETIQADRSGVLVTIVRGSDEAVGRKLLLQADGEVRTELRGDLADRALRSARAALAHGVGGRTELGEPEDGNACEAFLERLEPSPRLIVVGGVHIAIALTAIASALGFKSVVVDPRRAFGNESRFPEVGAVVSDWPDDALRGLGLDSSTAVAVLTHDPKLDDPALSAALTSDAFYVGALGSKRTQEKRRRRLLERGLSEAQLAKLHAPIGLDLGGRSPEEIALSIMAQIVSVRNRT